MKIKTCENTHLVMASNLNHHGTLFAGQCTSWFVEAGFMAAADMTSPERIVCLNIHGMVFKKRVLLGTMIRFESRVVWAGRSSLVVYGQALERKSGASIVDGFLTFVHVDQEGRALPHGITVEATTPEELALQAQAKALGR
jgi:acyl-CoA hydrolase